MHDSQALRPVAASERTSTPESAAFIWLAATMSATSIPLGGMIATGFPHTGMTAVVVAAALLFVLVGLISVPGFVFAVPTMVISEALFGKRINRGIAASNWLSQVGWESVVLVIVIYLVRTLLFGSLPRYTAGQTLIAFGLSLAANFAVPLIGYRAIVQAQRASAVLLLALVPLILLHLTPHPQAAAATAPRGLTGFLGALSLASMGGALSWTTFAADYSRFIRPGGSLRRVVMGPFLGGLVGTCAILFTAVRLSEAGGVDIGRHGITMAASVFYGDTYQAFCAFALLGLLASNFLNAYSSAFSLAVFLQKDLGRRLSTAIDAAVATGLATWMLFFAPSFLDVFQVFLSMIILVAAPWTGIVAVHVVADLIMRRTPTLDGLGAGRRRNGPVLALGMLATAVFSANPVWTGAGAQALHAVDISPLVGLAAGAALTAVTRLAFPPRALAGASADG